MLRDPKDSLEPRRAKALDPKLDVVVCVVVYLCREKWALKED